jgi:hypothetical protein
MGTKRFAVGGKGELVDFSTLSTVTTHLKLGDVVLIILLLAQVVDLVLVVVLRRQEIDDVVDVISVECFEFLRRKSHRNDVGANVWKDAGGKQTRM